MIIHMVNLSKVSIFARGISVYIYTWPENCLLCNYLIVSLKMAYCKHTYIKEQKKTHNQFVASYSLYNRTTHKGLVDFFQFNTCKYRFSKECVIPFFLLYNICWLIIWKTDNKGQWFFTCILENHLCMVLCWFTRNSGNSWFMYTFSLNLY